MSFLQTLAPGLKEDSWRTLALFNGIVQWFMVNCPWSFGMRFVMPQFSSLIIIIIIMIWVNALPFLGNCTTPTPSLKRLQSPAFRWKLWQGGNLRKWKFRWRRSRWAILTLHRIIIHLKERNLTGNYIYRRMKWSLGSFSNPKCTRKWEQTIFQLYNYNGLTPHWGKSRVIGFDHDSAEKRSNPIIVPDLKLWVRP